MNLLIGILTTNCSTTAEYVIDGENINLQLDNLECVDNCDNYVIYSVTFNTNEYKVCSQGKEVCPPTYAQTFDKRQSSSNNQCQEDCTTIENEVWYLSEVNEKICSNSIDCASTMYQYYAQSQPRECYSHCLQTSSLENPQLFESLSDEYQCVESCGENIVYYQISLSNSYEDYKCSDSTKCNIVDIPPYYQKNDSYLCVRCETYQNYIYQEQCLETCNRVDLQFVAADSQECVENCNGFTSQLKNYHLKCTNNPVCDMLDDDGLKYFTVENTKECIQPDKPCDMADGDKYIYEKDVVNMICKPVLCKQYYKDEYKQQNFECLNSCDNYISFYYNIDYNSNQQQVQICSTQDTDCPPQHPDSISQEYRQKLTKYIQQEDEKLCLESCMSQQYFLMKDQQHECDYNCYTDEMNNQYTFQYIDNDLKCNNYTQCKDDEFLVDNIYQCIKQTQACFDQSYQVFIKNEQICQDITCIGSEYPLLNKYDENDIYCIKDCEDGIEFKYPITYKEQQGNVDICQQNQTSCPPSAWDGSDSEYINTLTKVLYNHICLSKCYDENDIEIQYYLSSDDENTCLQDCEGDQLFRVQQNGERKCFNILEEEYCPSNKTIYIHDKWTNQVKGVQCVEQCMNADTENTKYYIESVINTNACTDQCDQWNYQSDNNDRICTACSEEQYILSDTKQCISLTDDKCPDEDTGKYTKNTETKQCVRYPCSIDGYYYENQYSTETTKKCYSKCIGVWFYDQQHTDKHICRQQEQSCPPQVLSGDDEQYINSLQKIQNGQCVTECNQDLYYINYVNENLCQSLNNCDDFAKILYKDQKYYIHCDSSIDCNQYTENKVQQLYHIDQDYKYLTTDYICISQCESGIYYQYNGQNQCIDQCGDNPELFTLELSQNMCSYYTNEECKQLYHIETENQNTKCQYVKDAQDCSVYDNYGKYNYKFGAQQKLCIKCNEDNQFVSADKTTCVSSCEQDSGNANYTWYHDIESNIKYCTDLTSCPPNNDDLQQYKYFVPDTYQCSDKECKYIDGNKYTYNQEDKTICVVNIKCKNNLYFYIDQHYDQQDQYCLEKCDDNVWYYYPEVSPVSRDKVCDTEKAECPPTKPEGEDYNYVDDLINKAVNQCVAHCYDADKNIVTNYDGKCVEDCGENNTYYIYLAQDGTNQRYKVCKNSNICDVTSSIPPEQTIGKQCKQCDEGYNYLQDNKCVKECGTYSNKIFVSQYNQTCVESCEGKVWSLISLPEKTLYQCRQNDDCVYNDKVKEYLVEYNRQCISETQECEVAELFDQQNNIYYHRNDENHICETDYCKTYNTYFYKYKYDKDAYNCIEHCETVWYSYIIDEQEYKIRRKVCDMIKSDCPPTEQQDQDLQYLSSLTKDLNKECVDKCLNNIEGYAFFTSATNDSQCISYCGGESKIRQQNDDYYCLNETVCDYEQRKEYDLQNDYRCVQYSKACLGDFIQNLVKDKDNHLCMMYEKCYMDDAYYADKYSNTSTCYGGCNTIGYYYPIKIYDKEYFAMVCDTKKQQCPPTNPGGEENKFIDSLTKLKDTMCVSQCSYENQYSYPMFYYKQENQCVENCPSVWFITDDGEWQCANGESCPPEENPNLIKVTLNYNCIDKCSNDEYYKYQASEDELQCIENCDNVWRVIDGENVCQDNDCIYNDNVKELYIQDTDQCIDATECPNTNEKSYILVEEQHRCIVNQCSLQGFYYVQYYDENEIQCFDYCDGIWFVQNISETKQVQVCRPDEYECPPQTLEGGQLFEQFNLTYDNQCVDKCDNDKNMYQLLQQPNECTDNLNYCRKYQYSYTNIIYSDNKTYLYCNYGQLCQGMELYNKVDAFVYQYDNNIRLEVICTDQCIDKVWYRDANHNLCLQSPNCGNEPDHFSIDIQTYQCALLTYQECENLYHIETDQFNTKCQYIQNAQSCQDYELYGGFIYSMKDNEKICSKCDQNNQQIADNKCVIKEDKLSSGAIAGIVIACIVVIAVVVIISVVIIKKKKGQNKGSENQNRDLKVATRE